MVEIDDTSLVNIDEVFQVYQLSRQHAGFEERGALSRNEFFEQIAEEELVLVSVGQHLAGFASVYTPQNFIHHFYILPSFQRQGNGRTLLEFVVKNFSLPLALRCEKENFAALQFYKMKGWEEFSRGNDDKNGTPYIQLIYGLN